VHHGMFATVDRQEGPNSQWQVALGAWNEQHCYPIAKNFAEVPGRWWYMGDIPHGWACAELMLLLRDILFFEADEDENPHIYLAPGVMPHWVQNNQSVTVRNASTLFGQNFGFTLTHKAAQNKVEIQILQVAPANVSFVYPCRFGSSVVSASANGTPVPALGRDVHIPAGTTQVTVQYA
jgi:hypothetical protein